MMFSPQRLFLALCVFNVFPLCISTTIVGPAVRLGACWKAMNESDSDRTNSLNLDEYFNFTMTLDATADDVFAGITSAQDAPEFWHQTWTALVSVCPNDPKVQNCSVANNNTLFVSPIPPKEGITEDPELYVFTICWSTYAALRHSLESEAPSVAPSSSPTVPPTSAPSLSPSTPPTMVPTPPPSREPSSPPTTSRVPTAPPTTSPTMVPTTHPTRQPSSPPTTSQVPTAPPTISHNPTGTPMPTISSAPSAFPSLAPTQAPSVAPSSFPTYAPVERETELVVKLAFLSVEQDENDNYILQEHYSNALLAQQELLADSVPLFETGVRALSVFSDRRLCMIEPLSTVVCPASELTETELEDAVCQNMKFTCYLFITGEDTAKADEIVANAQSILSELNRDGSYQSELDQYTNDIKVLASNSGAASIGGNGTETLSPAATGGMVTAAILAVMLPFVLLLVYRNRGQDNKDQKEYYEPYDIPEDAPSELEPDAMDADLYAGATQQGRAVSILGASRPSYGMTKATQKYLEDVERGEDILAEPEFDVERDSSSNAGSSGWSSSAGYSSYNTGSMDDSMDAAMANVTSLAAIGVTSSLSNNVPGGSRARSSTTNSITSDAHTSISGGSVGSPSVSRDQLDNFIEAGDWAAVGATAALLAAASDSQSASSAGRSQRSRASSHESNSLEAARAAELDHLVDAGDWEGVVLAAARFEAAEMSVSSKGSRTASSVGSTGSHSRTDDGGKSAGSQSESQTNSDDPSRARQRKEIRAEVEALVRRVVPEEIDNVDEMMNQFKGREEELVETLRTMQERAIAQKARSAGHKSAKLEARKNAKRRSYVPGARPPPGPSSSSQGSSVPPAASGIPPRPVQAQQTPPPVAAAPRPVVAAAPGVMNGSKNSVSGSASIGNDSSTLGSLAETRTALDKAIDAGDWEAVGRAAASISDASVNTTETGEVGLAGQSIMSVASGSTRTRTSKDNESAVRAAELDDMINRGDWNGVVQAAHRFSQMDKRVKSDMGRTAEEEEALAQAEFWTKIANQKKAEGGNDAGASDAAEWAIQRSLSQLKEADRKKDASPKNEEDEDEV